MPHNDRLDTAIGKRLREFRESILIPRTALAQSVGTTADKLSNYERGRTALPWGIFVKIWKGWSLSPRWLATGEGSKLLAFAGIGESIGPFESRSLFSDVYQSTIAPFLAGAKAGRVSAVALLSSLDAETYDGIQPGAELPADAHPATASMEIVLRGSATTVLDDVSDSIQFAKVLRKTPQLPKLLNRLRVATKAYGAKKQLAEFLGVPSQHIHRWLSGLAEPGGETTLQLREWVEAAEASQQKAAGRVAARPAKTQAKSNRETKQSSGPLRK